MSINIQEEIKEIERLIVETEGLIKEGWKLSESMMEPIKTQFTNQLENKQIELDMRREFLEVFKRLKG